MAANPILICARARELRAELEDALAEAGYRTITVTTPADAVATMRGTEIDLIVAEGLAASGAIASLRMAREGQVTPILVVAPAHDVEARIAFLEAGADDVIAGGFARNELESRVEALLIRTGKVRPESAKPASGELVAFFSPKGGVGTTTLAVNTAILLAGGASSTPGAMSAAFDGTPRVALIDLDLQFGQVATHLNLTPRYDVGVLAADEAALADPDIARSYLTVHPTGVAVLSAPPRPEADFAVTLDQVQQLVQVLRPSYDHVIVDLGGRLDPRALWVLEQSDAQVLVLFPEIAALRATSLLLAFLAESAAYDTHSHIVINHVFPKELLKTRDVENLLRTKPVAEVPYAEVEMIRAVNEGVPIVVSHPTSPASAAMRRVAQAIIGIDQMAMPDRAPERRGLFRRRSGA
jgi:pilus assembly protein CpaE